MATNNSARTVTSRDFVSLPLKFFSIVGVKLFNWDENDTMSTIEKISLFVFAVNMVICFIVKLSFVLFKEFKDTVQMTEWILYFGFSHNGLFKLLTVVLGRKTISQVLKDLESLTPRDTKECKNFNMAQGFDYVMSHSKIMYISHWTIAIMFIICPLVQSSVQYFRTGVFIPGLPYIMAYPFDETASVGYIVAYISQVLAGFAISAYFLGADMLLICTVYMVILQYRHLCNRIEDFEPKNYEQDMKELKEILDKHNVLNVLAEAVNSVFNVSILINYMVSILVIVLIGVQIVSGSDLLDFIKFGGFFFASTVQMYYVCMFGTQLMECSSLVGESFIGQKWYMADVRYQRILILAITRSQKPAHLTAFKFFIISMESFSDLMTTAYQCFTLLKTRMEEETL